ncbi:Transposase [Paenibacillus typhae]|uniref:Uncharacterized protein n=1 Tax=Paenibacillus typhae TaxID=1174501 RepID=A0A1G9FT34_9BACL|nr:hypothetical protein SAMN05216192_1615 [Paenibacillus typhae]
MLLGICRRAKIKGISALDILPPPYLAHKKQTRPAFARAGHI